MVPQGHNFFHLTGLLGTLVANRATVVRWTFTAVAGGIAGVRILSNFLNYTRLFQMCLFFVECICPKRKQRVSAKRNSLHPMQGNLKHTWHGAYGYYLTNLQASQEGSLVDRLTLSVTPITNTFFDGSIFVIAIFVVGPAAAIQIPLNTTFFVFA